MKKLTVREIAESVDGIFSGSPDMLETEVSSVVRDSREVRPGSLFLCFKGERSDGHDFAAAAIDAGAVCVITERDLPGGTPGIRVKSTAGALRRLGKYYREKLNIPIIGVTGSVGKTTTKEMIAAVLMRKFSVHKTPENLNNDIGVPLTLLGIEPENDIAVVEMGISDFGEMDILADMVSPNICVMTRIAEAHLETLGDLNGVLKAKSEVFRHMPRDGIAIINGDDTLLSEFNPGIRKITFGLGLHNDYRAANISTHGADGVAFDIITPSGKITTSIQAYGEHIAIAAAAAAAVGELYGLDLEHIKRGLGEYKTIQGRSNIINTGFVTIIDDCYNANPASVRSALKELAKLQGRRVAILGDMNDLGVFSKELHREIGGIAANCGIDCVICCGGKAEFIFKGVIAANTGIEAHCFPFINALLERLPALIKEGDNVLVKASHSMNFYLIAERLKMLN